MDKKKIKAGFKEAKNITKKFAKTFYLASLFLTRKKKYASYAVYAICRLSDEAVDDFSGLNPVENLKKLEQRIACAYTQHLIDTPLLAAFRDTVNTYQIPKEYFDTLIKGMYMDLELKSYPDFTALNEYCYRVAGIVGLIMLKIFGSKNDSAQAYAVKLGIAMQLTNILRDIKEDLLRNRIYLPQDELREFGVPPHQLSAGQNNEAFKNLMRFQIERATKLYSESLKGIPLIRSRRARFVVLIMQDNYRRILTAIGNNDFDVFSRRAQVSRTRKITAILKIFFEGKYL